MSTKQFASWPSHNGRKVVLDNDTRLVTYQAGATTAITLKVYTATGTSVAGGGCTFTLPAGYFTTVYTATATVIRDTTDPTQATFAMIRSQTTSTVVAHTFESKTSGVLLGGSTEGLESCGAGQTIQLMVLGV